MSKLFLLHGISTDTLFWDVKRVTFLWCVIKTLPMVDILLVQIKKRFRLISGGPMDTLSGSHF